MKCVLLYCITVTAALAVVAGIAGGPSMVRHRPGDWAPIGASGLSAAGAETGPSVVRIEERVPQLMKDAAVAAAGRKEAERGRFSDAPPSCPTYLRQRH